jgi:hypothetical protein
LQSFTTLPEGPAVVLEVAMKVGDSPAHVLCRRFTYVAQEDTVLRIPDLQNPVGCLPSAFEERTAWQCGYACPPVGSFLPLFWARSSHGC